MNAPPARHSRTRPFTGPLPGLLALVASLAFAAFAPTQAHAETHFTTDILPILTKAGCNAGACHGAATGQGGFKLSLHGYAPALDHQRITRELGGRRIDLAHPDESLLLRKATRKTDHEGGRRLLPDAPETLRLQDWIARGAPLGDPTLHVTRLQADPPTLVAGPSPKPHPLRITATLSDGSTRDVSSLALVSSNDDAVADIERPSGHVRFTGHGSTALMIRFAGAVAAVHVDNPFPGPAATQPDSLLASTNPVDHAILRRLRELNVPASPDAPPATFLRRVHLDLTGRLPQPQQIESFLAQPDSPTTRAALVDTLLASPEFTDLWTLRLADLLLLGGNRTAEPAARAQHDWLHTRIAQRTGWNRIAHELLTARGSLETNGATAFVALASDPRDLAEHAASLFLGIRVGCARCHAHPTDRWTRRDYHQFAAFFTGTRRDNGRVLDDDDGGGIEDPDSGQILAPRPLGAAPLPEIPPDRSRAAADWITQPGNPLFARAFVNRVWKHLLGRGLVEPADDLRPTNPATHPDLLDTLAADFEQRGYDLRRLVRIIVLSEAYRRSASVLPGNATDSTLFSHARLKAPEAAVLHDMIAQATGIDEPWEGQPAGTRAVQLPGLRPGASVLDLLGRCSRNAPCDTATAAGGGLARTLHLINGPTIGSRLDKGRLAGWLQQGLSTREFLRQLYLHTLSRPPTSAELTHWSPLLDATHDRREAAQDLLWALLNSREFAWIH